MPTTMPPLIIADNVFDRINLYPGGALSSSGDAIGRPVQAVADYRRERSYWQAASSAANTQVQADVGATVTVAPDALWIDRGHNLWGATIQYLYGNGGTTSAMLRTVPALGTVGGDPETGFCVTEEGAIYTLWPAAAANRYHVVRVVTNMQPIITGIVLGARTQLLQYSGVMDEDAGGRTRVSTESVAGYEAVERAYAYRTLTLRLATIGATEYDNQIRYLRRVLFERNQPCFIVPNYGRWPARGWLYRYDGRGWSAPANRVYRSVELQMREVGALIR